MHNALSEEASETFLKRSTSVAKSKIPLKNDGICTRKCIGLRHAIEKYRNVCVNNDA